MIHPQLLADCYHLGGLAHCELLLHRNGLLPWFILVPGDAATGGRRTCDLLDLSAVALQGVLADCTSMSRFLKEELGCPKVNFAALGNVVPQLHLHVIGRREGDACWPLPVWGHLESGLEHGDAAVDRWTDLLRREYGLCVTA